MTLEEQHKQAQANVITAQHWLLEATERLKRAKAKALLKQAVTFAEEDVTTWTERAAAANAELASIELTLANETVLGIEAH